MKLVLDGSPYHGQSRETLEFLRPRLGHRWKSDRNEGVVRLLQLLVELFHLFFVLRSGQSHDCRCLSVKRLLLMQQFDNPGTCSSCRLRNSFPAFVRWHFRLALGWSEDAF